MTTKYEDRYLRGDTQGASSNRERRDWDARRRSYDDRRNRNWQGVMMIGEIIIEMQTGIDPTGIGFFKRLFSDKPGLTHVLYHEIDTGDKLPVVSRPYRYDRVKHGIIDHVDKMSREGTIIPIQSPYGSSAVLYRKNNGLPPDNTEVYRFAVYYRKLYAITKYHRYPLPLIEDLITNILHTNIMSSLDLRSGYFQLAVKPSDEVKTVLS
ncbi:retrovirus-related Pol polyprotein from transposon 17.6 [Trichonephila clavipes]|nr:retrovirus-related Pol polyprotein from transposon 17.6 [Trichonephila clavipes]